MPSTTCKNCSFSYKGHFCPQCGQSSHEGRINAHYILHDIPHTIFHIDKGFFFTFRSLFTRPGRMISEFMEGKRVNHFRPFAYVVLMSTICTFLVKGIEWAIKAVFVKYNPGSPQLHEESFFAHYFSLFIFIMIPFASLITWLTFYKKKFNFWEHIIVNTYMAAQLNIMLVLVNLVALIIVLLTHKRGNIDFGIFIYIFMTAFLYLYGSVFGYVFKETIKGKYRSFQLSFTITLMNFALLALYVLGFRLAGIMSPW